MRIISLHIYGFGKFVDKKIEFISPNFQVFYGENEAGKSTILAFIRAVLFGFPTKQSKEERFEPKLSSAYGGKVTIATDRYGSIDIERVKGKAKGDVKVYMPDGEVQGEEFLQKLLMGVDRTIFQGVFSFGLQDLNDVSQVESEELGKYLYGVGMAGRNSIVELEKELLKKQEDLFKRQGKKPIINTLLNEMEQLQKKIAERKKEEQKYNEIFTEKEKIESEIDQLKIQIQLLETEMKELEMIERLKPYMTKRQLLTSKLQQLNPLLKDFPHDGEKRLDELNIKLESLEEQLIELEKNKQLCEEKLSLIALDEEILSLEANIKSFQQRIGKYEQVIIEKQKAQQILTAEQQQLADVLDQLGHEWNEEIIEQAITTMEAKKQLNEFIQQENRLQEQKNQLIADIKQREMLLKEKEHQLEQVSEKINAFEPIEQLKQNLQQILERIKQRDILAQEIQLLKTEQTKIAEKQKKPYLIIVAIVFFLFLGAWGVITKEWLVVTVTVFAILLMFGFIKQQKNDTRTVNNEQWLKEKLTQFEQLNNEQLEQQEKTISLQIERLTNLTMQYEQLEHQLAFEKSTLSRVKQREQMVEEELLQLENALVSWCHTNSFQPLKKASLLNEIYTLVANGKKYLATIAEQHHRIHEWEQFERTFIQEKERIAQMIGEDPNGSTGLIAENSLRRLESEKNKRIEYQQLMERLTQITENLAIQKEKKQYYENERNMLFSKAHVEHESMFRERLHMLTEKIQLEKELAHCETELAMICQDDVALKEYETKIFANVQDEMNVNDLPNELETKREQLKQLEKEAIELQVKLNQLEQETSLSETLQQYELKKTELFEKAKDWAVYRMSLQLLEDAKRIYETERQPFVIKKAKQFFMMMTDDEYVNVFAPVGENTFVVENRNGLRFTPNELSQGTREQLYLAIRLALASVYQEHSSFPIIMDDIFVNFDRKRRTAAQKVIEEMAKHHQILFFTCHQHICSLFSRFPIYRL